MIKANHFRKNDIAACKKSTCKTFCKCFFLCRDSDRIQTCNLLIRSQMLYSVKLRSLYLRVQKYTIFVKAQNKFEGKR